MRCHEVQQNLDLFIRQELMLPVREELEVHLSDCERCREELARLRKLAELLAATPSPPVPVGFAGRVVERARLGAVPDSAVVHARRRIGRSLRVAASMALALAGGLLLGGYLGARTWSGPPPAAQHSDPLGDLGLGQFVEPGGDSLAHAYLALTSGDDS